MLGLYLDTFGHAVEETFNASHVTGMAKKFFFWKLMPTKKCHIIFDDSYFGTVIIGQFSMSQGQHRVFGVYQGVSKMWAQN